jgi:hypothetical protein
LVHPDPQLRPSERHSSPLVVNYAFLIKRNIPFIFSKNIDSRNYCHSPYSGIPYKASYCQKSSKLHTSYVLIIALRFDVQMIERPLLTADELKSLPKGNFVVMKIGVHPMKTKLRLFLDWGITFEKAYETAEKSHRKVYYADKEEL